MILQGSPDIPDNVVGVIAIISIFVLFPIVLAFARMLWKRGSAPMQPRQIVSEELSQRLMQMQHSIDAMAIEVERIAEGQRFVTKLMADKAPAAAQLSGRAGDPH